MSDCYLGEIRMFAGTFAPRLWGFCHGDVVAISQNQSLFALVGSIYGGDGRVSFALPDLRSRVPMGQGTGPGLTTRAVGQRFGVEQVTLAVSEIPAHTHRLQASASDANSTSPAGRVPANVGDGNIFYDTNATKWANYGTDVGNTGANVSHSNIMPYQSINFIVALQGVFPQRN